MKAADTDIAKIQYYRPFSIIKPIITATLLIVIAIEKHLYDIAKQSGKFKIEDWAAAFTIIR